MSAEEILTVVFFFIFWGLLMWACIWFLNKIGF